jgi:Zn-finger domain-containing protein
MTADDALKAMSKNKIVWFGMIVTHCECGADISKAKRVRVKTFEEYMRDMK